MLKEVLKDYLDLFQIGLWFCKHPVCIIDKGLSCFFPTCKAVSVSGDFSPLQREVPLQHD